MFGRILPNREAILLVKDFTSDQARNAVEFYLVMMSVDQQPYNGLLSHLKVAVQMGETFTFVVSNFYSHYQKGKETEDTFGDELQVLAC